MGREVRMVPADWQHPKRDNGSYIALYDGTFTEDAKDWDDEEAKWNSGEYPDYADEESKKLSFSDWYGKRPDPADYMPEWQDSEKTHYMMYETTSEGTPISPAFAAPEELARWLADTGASSFGTQTASYEGWLRVAKGGYACSAVYSSDTGLVSGVDAL